MSILEVYLRVNCLWRNLSDCFLLESLMDVVSTIKLLES